MRRWGAALLAAVILAVTFLGCGDTEPDSVKDATGVTFTDALEREITVASPQRVVALMGGFAEVWLLAGGELVGVSADAVEERELDLPGDIAVVGLFNTPSSEAVLALEPDLVLLSSETSAHQELLPVLEGAGITCAAFRVNDFQDYLGMLQTCTEITGRADLYRQHGQQVADRIDALQAQYTGSDAGTALLLITYSQGALAQDSGTMAGAMLAEMGCDNLADHTPSLLRELSVEHILIQDPDWIFVIAMGNDEELAQRHLVEAVENHPAWGSLRAVQEGRYLLLPKELFLYKPNARWAESYEYLAEALYGA